MRAKPAFFIASCMLATSVASCVDAPSADELVSQRIVVTQFDPAVSFGTFESFAIVDTIPVVTAFDAGVSGDLDPSVADPILGEIAAQLSSRGYRRVDRSQSPDLAVNVEAILALRSADVTAYGAWWGSGPANPSSWGLAGGSLVAPFGYTTVAWRSGTLVTELYDLRDARTRPAASAAVSDGGAAANTVEVVWGLLVHGVVGSTLSAPVPSPPLDEIRQGFAQSPYLARAEAPP
jgi:hypothetical protein